MNHKLGQLLLLILLVSLSASIPCAGAQQRELPLEKILNPLPDFDPFEKPLAPPQYFPDDVDKRTRDALIDALFNDKAALEQHLTFFKSEDGRLQKERQAATGLTEHVQDLVNNTVLEREPHLAAQRAALKNASSDQRKKYLEAIINQDDLTQADHLMRRSSTNFWGGMLNRLLSSVDLVGVASGNYIGAAVETAVSQLYALAERDMPIEERRALARDLDFLKRFPDDPRSAEIRKRAESLDKKKAATLAQKQLAKADEALAKGESDKALFHAELASFFDPQSRDAQKALERTTKLSKERDERQGKALAATEEPRAPAERDDDVKRLLQALSLRDAHQVERVAVDIDKKYPGTPLADAARDAEAVAMEMKGWHEAAKKAIAQIIRSAINPEAKTRASTLLQSREYNLLGSFEDARSDRRLQSAKYVLLGEDLLKKNLLYAAGAVAVGGPAGAGAAMVMVNAMMVGNNLYQVVTHNPVSAQPVIDAGVAYVRNHPNSENASEVYKVLAEAFEERGMLDKAINYYELSGTASKEKIADLNEKMAKAYLNAANKNKERAAQESYLTTILDIYPESSAAAEATKKLAELAKDENRGLRMSKQFLMENPEIYGPRGLGLKPSLFDGNTGNMELAERGVNLIGDNEMLIYYQTPWGVRSQSYPLSKPMADRFFATLRQKNLEVALADVNQRAKGSAGGIRNLPLPVIRAEGEKRGERSEERGDTTFTFVREAGGPAATYPKVLDYELLSENERDPGSKYRIPPIQGSISASRFSMSGALPAGLWGNRLAIGTDQKGTFAGVELPIPLLQGFIPVDFMVQGRPGGFSVYPKIHLGKDSGADPELYR
ncbi:MAG: hypothetical protein HYW03_03285 [Deltaproteobacteria bacterium]|nr:hypothetical protein [Deltaproteobacteria bacterium]